ncbi:MAG: hypothetical protein HYX97_07310 [Chloroflexi bacterium]|nr:hypothetical protein [Chloroflexota bacterium]
MQESNGLHENPIASITIKYNDGTTTTVEGGYFLALLEPAEDGHPGFSAFMMMDEDPHLYLELLATLGEVQTQLAHLTHDVLAHPGGEQEPS